jgi:hypothetical protein
MSGMKGDPYSIMHNSEAARFNTQSAANKTEKIRTHFVRQQNAENSQKSAPPATIASHEAGRGFPHKAAQEREWPQSTM